MTNPPDRETVPGTPRRRPDRGGPVTWIMNRLRRWYERHLCRNTTVELVIVQSEGQRPQIRVRVIDKCAWWVLGEAYFGPDRMAALCREGERLAAQIRDEYPLAPTNTEES